MARYSIAGRATVAGTSARAIASIFATANNGFTLREVGVFNTVATAVAVSLVRFTNQTGVGTGLTEAPWNKNKTQTVTGFAAHTADGGIGDTVRQASLGAAIGSGVIFTFGDEGYQVDNATTNGVGIICPTGTGQILDFYYDWEE